MTTRLSITRRNLIPLIGGLFAASTRHARTQEAARVCEMSHIAAELQLACRARARPRFTRSDIQAAGSKNRTCRRYLKTATKALHRRDPVRG